jgi:hypothetical protein
MTSALKPVKVGYRCGNNKKQHGTTILSTTRSTRKKSKAESDIYSFPQIVIRINRKTDNVSQLAWINVKKSS